MTNEPAAPDPRAGGATPTAGAAAAPRRTRRWVWAVLIGVLVVVLFVVGGSVRRVMAARERLAAKDGWTATRRHQFRRECLEEARRPLPDEARLAEGFAPRYCSCVADGLAKAFPSFSRGFRAAGVVRPPGQDADADRAAEIFARCTAQSR